MKLEFESNVASMPLVNDQDAVANVSEGNSAEVMQMLRDGIKAAQEGNRADARQLLMRVTEADSNNENAWLWLASISEYPEELLVFLNNVLKINSENERAIEWAKATKSLLAKTFVQRGINVAKDGQKDFARQCFLQAIVHDDQSELAWLWLASVSDSVEEKVSHLQKVLKINPSNENAKSSLASAKAQIAQAMMPKAKQAAVEGNHKEAHRVLDKILGEAPDLEDAWLLKSHLSDSLSEKIIYFEKVLAINPQNDVAKSGLASLKSLIGEVSQPKENVVEKEVAKEEEQQQELSQESTESFEESDLEKEESEVELQSEEDDDEIVSESEMQSEVEETMELQESVDFAVDEEDVVEYTEEQNEDVEEVFAEESSEVEAESVEEVLLEQDDEYVKSDDESQKLDDESEEVSFEVEQDETELEVDYSDDDDEMHLFNLEEDGEQELENEKVEALEVESFENEQESVHEENDFNQEIEMPDEPVSQDYEEFAHEEEVVSFEDVKQFANNNPEEYFVQEEAEEEEKQDEEENYYVSEPSMPKFESVDEAEVSAPNSSEEHSVKLMSCPFCNEANEPQSFVCKACRAILTLSDIEMILGHEKANQEIIRQSVEMMEEERKVRNFDAEELTKLGIGYINIKDMRKGFEYLQEAIQANPEDVVLVSHVDSLAIRLAEIEQQKKDNSSKPATAQILVVDDSPTVRKLISGKLEKCGHEVICAVDGMDALAKINESIPDLILLDITMPRMDGYQVCKLIRSNEATQDVPVVMISGKDGFFDKVRGKMAGTTNYITKPFGPETLMKTINEYIG